MKAKLWILSFSVSLIGSFWLLASVGPYPFIGLALSRVGEGARISHSQARRIKSTSNYLHQRRQEASRKSAKSSNSKDQT